MTRKSPIRHKVRAYTRQRQHVDSYSRGSGSRPARVRKRVIVGLKHVGDSTKFIEGNFESNVSAFIHLMERVYNVNIGKLKIYKYDKEDEFAKAFGEPLDKTQAFTIGTKAIHFGPEITEDLTRGRLVSEADVAGMIIGVHEISHIIGYTPTGEAFDEGSNELLATRFVLNNIPMGKKIKKDVTCFAPYAYSDDVQMVADYSLLVNGGDEKKAIDWLIKFWHGGSIERGGSYADVFKKKTKSCADAFEKWKSYAPEGFHLNPLDLGLKSGTPKLKRVKIKVAETLRKIYPKTYMRTRYTMWGGRKVSKENLEPRNALVKNWWVEV